jgi:hypothetical protein
MFYTLFRKLFIAIFFVAMLSNSIWAIPGDIDNDGVPDSKDPYVSDSTKVVDILSISSTLNSISSGSKSALKMWLVGTANAVSMNASNKVSMWYDWSGNKNHAGLYGLSYKKWNNGGQNYAGTPDEIGIESYICNKFSTSSQTYSAEFTGYFYTQNYSGNFTFYTNSDDESFLWITKEGSEIMVVNNGGNHGNQESSGIISLNANTYYPIRIRTSNTGSAGNLNVYFENIEKGLSRTYNGSGFYFPSDQSSQNSSLPTYNATGFN